jgi:hypothetical protein
MGENDFDPSRYSSPDALSPSQGLMIIDTDQLYDFH